jgi:hypothetical protein
MCFSTTASLGTSATLAVIGSIILMRNYPKKSSLFATVPFFFSMQQMAEGLVWLSFEYPVFEQWRTIAGFLFLLFAFAVWPAWIPFLLYYLEPIKYRKQLLSKFAIAGCITAFCLLIFLLSIPISIILENHHIKYGFVAPLWLDIIFTILYLISTITSFFISSIRGTKLFGRLLIASYIVSYIFFSTVHISVWCFFAALLSILLVWIAS